MRFTPGKVKVVPKRETTTDKDAPDYISDKWARLTMRPREVQWGAEEKQKLTDAIENSEYSQKMSNPRVFDSIIRLASFLPQVKYDELDMGRILDVLTDPLMYSVANSLMKKASAKPLTYHEALASSETLNELSHYGGYESYSRAPREEQEYILRLYHTRSDIIESIFAQSMRGMTFQEAYSVWVKDGKRSRALYPSVSKDNQVTKSSIMSRKVKKPKKVDFYSEANTVQNAISETYLDVDEEASDLMMQGATMDVVMKFHNQAPDGYWKAVTNRVLANDNLDLPDVYDSLEDVFNFHPQDRDLPII